MHTYTQMRERERGRQEAEAPPTFRHPSKYGGHKGRETKAVVSGRRINNNEEEVAFHWATRSRLVSSRLSRAVPRKPVDT